MCNKCIKPLQVGSIEDWRDNSYTLLNNARKIFVPDSDVAKRMEKYYPSLKFDVRPHITVKAYKDSFASAPNIFQTNNSVLNVAIIGAIGHHKGSNLIFECIKDAFKRSLPIHFTIIGYTNYDDLMRNFSNVTITGKYLESEVINLIKSNKCNVAFFSSVWPETFCYTLSIAFASKLYPISFEIGAVAERIKQVGWGKILPISMINKPKEINDSLLMLEITPLSEQVNLFNIDYNNLIKDYYQLS
jgi:glycosyltransferase involved in cell wall biosynthesis